ncbi:transposase [Streptomyces sp. SAI-041]|nr:transposase [Streptomyces sp. SAI-041]
MPDLLVLRIWAAERGDLSDAEWERLRPFLSVSNGRAGGGVVTGRCSTGSCIGYGPGCTGAIYQSGSGRGRRSDERHRLWSADGTWERLLQHAQAAADVVEIDYGILVDPTSVRAAARGRRAERLASGTCRAKGGHAPEHQDERRGSASSDAWWRW